MSKTDETETEEAERCNQTEAIYKKIEEKWQKFLSMRINQFDKLV